MSYISNNSTHCYSHLSIFKNLNFIFYSYSKLPYTVFVLQSPAYLPVHLALEAVRKGVRRIFDNPFPRQPVSNRCMALDEITCVWKSYITICSCQGSVHSLIPAQLYSYTFWTYLQVKKRKQSHLPPFSYKLLIAPEIISLQLRYSQYRVTITFWKSLPPINHSGQEIHQCLFHQ